MPRTLAGFALLIGLACAPAAALENVSSATASDPLRRLPGFDSYMQKVLKDWNLPRIQFHDV